MFGMTYIVRVRVRELVSVCDKDYDLRRALLELSIIGFARTP